MKSRRRNTRGALETGVQTCALPIYRLVSKHGGRQEFGWSFDFIHLHAKSGSLSPLKHFAYDLRDIVRRQALPGYRLTIEQSARGPERLSFAHTGLSAFGSVRRRSEDGSVGNEGGSTCSVRGPRHTSNKKQ